MRLLIWEGYAPEKFVQEFETHIETTYGRKVRLQIEYTTGGDNDFYDPIREKTVDAVVLTHHLFKDEQFHFIDKGLLLPLDLINIPNFANLLPSLQQAEFLTSEDQIFGVPICQGPYGLAYNQDLLDSAPDSWNVLWDPAFRGKYSIAANEYMYNINITALAMGYSRESISHYDTLNNPPFQKKLRQLAVNAHSFWMGQDKPDDLSGLSVAAIWGDSIGPLAERGEHWVMTVPKEGTPYWIDSYAITWALADQPFLKMVAEQWINRMLGLDYQVENIVRGLTQTPVVDNINSSLSRAEALRLNLDNLDSQKGLRLAQPTVSRRDRNGLKALWSEATAGLNLADQPDPEGAKD